MNTQLQVEAVLLQKRKLNPIVLLKKISLEQEENIELYSQAKRLKSRRNYLKVTVCKRKKKQKLCLIYLIW